MAKKIFSSDKPVAIVFDCFINGLGVIRSLGKKMFLAINFYTDIESLKRIIEYCLESCEARGRLGDASYKWAYENATYTHRIKTALNYMGVN